MLEEFGELCELSDDNLFHLVGELAKKYEGRQIVMLVDEIEFNGEGPSSRDWLYELDDQSFPETVRMILVLNPAETNWSANSDTSLKMHPSILHVTLTTPYRSTRAITSFSRFLAKHWGMPEGEIGSDVEGSKPIFFDIGDEEKKMEEALRHCHKKMGDNVTVLYTFYGVRDSMEKMKKLVKDQGKEAGGPWDVYSAQDFYGWEAEKK